MHFFYICFVIYFLSHTHRAFIFLSLCFSVLVFKSMFYFSSTTPFLLYVHKILVTSDEQPQTFFVSPHSGLPSCMSLITSVKRRFFSCLLSICCIQQTVDLCRYCLLTADRFAYLGFCWRLFFECKLHVPGFISTSKLSYCIIFASATLEKKTPNTVDFKN